MGLYRVNCGKATATLIALATLIRSQAEGSAEHRTSEGSETRGVSSARDNRPHERPAPFEGEEIVRHSEETRRARPNSAHEQQAMIQISGHALDAMKSAHAGTSSIMNVEVMQAARDIGDLLSTSFLGSTYGLENAVAATGTYAGIARGSASYFESLVTAVNDNLALDDVIDLLEALEDNDRGGRSFCFIAPLNQRTNIWKLSGMPGMKQFSPDNPLEGFYSTNLAGWPVLGVGDLTDTVIIALETSPEQNECSVIRQMSTKDMSPSGDSDIVQVSCGAALVHRNPIKSGKLTGCTA